MSRYAGTPVRLYIDKYTPTGKAAKRRLSPTPTKCLGFLPRHEVGGAGIEEPTATLFGVARVGKTNPPAQHAGGTDKAVGSAYCRHPSDACGTPRLSPLPLPSASASVFVVVPLRTLTLV
jgi:hypothetical protein